MQFFKTAAAVATASLASTASASYALYINETISNLTTDIYPSIVSYANSSIFLGAVNEDLYAEPIVSGKGTLAFTSYHQVPTGGIEPYVFLDAYNPIMYTIAHTGYTVPPGANFTDFGFDADGYLTYGGENKFVACQDSVLVAQRGYQIFWAGNNSGPGADYACEGPIYLYQAEY